MGNEFQNGVADRNMFPKSKREAAGGETHSVKRIRKEKKGPKPSITRLRHLASTFCFNYGKIRQVERL